MGIPALPGVSGSNRNQADRANAVVFGTFAALGASAPLSVWGPMNVVVWGELADALTTTAGSANVTAASATGSVNGDTLVSANLPPGTTILSGGAGTALVATFPPQFWQGVIVNGSAIINFPAASSGPSLPADLTTLIGATILNSDYFASGTTILAADNTLRRLTASAAATAGPPNNQPAFIEFKPTGNAVKTSGADANALIMGPATAINLTLQLERSFDGGRKWIACNLGGDATLAQWVLTKPLSLSFGEPEAGMLYRLNCLAFAAVTNVTVRYRLSTTGQASTSLSVPAIS